MFGRLIKPRIKMDCSAATRHKLNRARGRCRKCGMSLSEIAETLMPLTSAYYRTLVKSRGEELE